MSVFVEYEHLHNILYNLCIGLGIVQCEHTIKTVYNLTLITLALLTQAGALLYVWEIGTTRLIWLVEIFGL